ncbi:MAG: hypothetical protein FJ264_06815 [Planctomycetes bacterium]|nr:hypothetical protein [Planctomycetota bacterium]
MGDEEIMAVVSDAGPLIHLSEIGGIALLQLFGIIHVPHTVLFEISKHRKNISKEITIADHNLPELQIIEFTRKAGLEKLHSGERECLYLCRQINQSILLTDDLAVRAVAKSLQITPVGSLGIVIKVYKDSRISLAEAEQYKSDLCDISSLFVTRTIVELVIEQLHKKTGN